MIGKLGRALGYFCLATAALVLTAGPQGPKLAHDSLHWISGYDHVHGRGEKTHRHSHAAKHAHEVKVSPAQPFLVSAGPQTATVGVLSIFLAAAPPAEIVAARSTGGLWRALDPPPRFLPRSYPPSLAAAPPAA